MSSIQPPKKGWAEPTAAEVDSLVDVAYSRLGMARSIGSYLAGGKLPDSIISGGGSHGSLFEATNSYYDRQRVYIYRPCEREVATARAWHGFCREHGYPGGDLCGADKDPANGYPEPPSHGGGVWVAITWAIARRELNRERKLIEELVAA